MLMADPISKMSDEDRKKLDEAWEQIKKDCARIKELRDELDSLGHVTMQVHDEITIEIGPENQERAAEIIEELNSYCITK